MNQPLPKSLLGKSWETQQGPVTSGHLLLLLEAVASGRQRYSAFSTAYSNSDRRVDRATQILRRAGLIEFAGGEWRLVVERVVGEP